MSTKKVRSPTRLFRQETKKAKEIMASEPNISVRLVCKSPQRADGKLTKQNSIEIGNTKGKTTTNPSTISTVTERGDASRQKRQITDQQNVLSRHEVKRAKNCERKLVQGSSERRFLDVAKHLLSKKNQKELASKNVVVQKKKLEVAIEQIGATRSPSVISEQSFPEVTNFQNGKTENLIERCKWRNPNSKIMNISENTIFGRTLKDNSGAALKTSRWRVDGKRVQRKKKKPQSPVPKDKETGGAKIRPESLDKHTKPYYEAWVSTKLAAVNNEVSDLQKCANYLGKIDETQIMKVDYDYTDERFTGRIKIRAKGLSGGKDTVERTL